MNSISPPRRLEDVTDVELVDEVLLRLGGRPAGIEATEVDRGEIVASAISDAAADYSERLTRIEGFVNGFRNVPYAVQWFEHVGQPILKMARGEKL